MYTLQAMLWHRCGLEYNICYTRGHIDAMLYSRPHRCHSMARHVYIIYGIASVVGLWVGSCADEGWKLGYIGMWRHIRML